MCEATRRQFQIREPAQQAQNRFLRLQPGQVRAQAQVSAAAEGLMMCILSLDIEAIGLRINSRVPVSRRQRYAE